MSQAFEDYKPPTRLKLAALWTATMFLYAYGDYFGLYVAGTLADMNRGIMGPLGPTTPGMLVLLSIMMAIPSVMVFLSLIIPPASCRWINVVFGIAYTGIMAISLPGSALFYTVLAIMEMALTMTIAVMAWRWPKITEKAPTT